MARAKADGRSIYISVFAKDLDDAVIASTDVSFPGRTDYVPGTDTSTDYFRYLVTNEILNVTYDFFAPKGVVPYKGNDPDEFEDENNGWCVVLDLKDSSPDGTPFLFTRNLIIEELDEEKDDLRSKLDGDRTPFGDKGLVVVYKGGQALEFTASQVSFENFNPGEQSNDVLRTGFYTP
jgi:hypothetical protein